MKKVLLRCLVLLMAMTSVSHAQNPATIGTEFWVSYLNITGASDIHYLSFFSDSNCVVYLSNPNSGWSDTVNVTAGIESRYTVPNAQVVHTVSEAVGNSGLYVRSTMPMALYAYNKETYLTNMDCTLVLPHNALGCQYVVNTYPESTSVPDAYKCSFVVMGVSEKSYDGDFYGDTTVVDIFLNGDTENNTSGTHQVVRLLPGQTYYVLGDIDLSGTLVQSRNGAKFAVFSGNRGVHIPSNAPGGDHLYTQLFPTQCWGKEFVVSPTQDHDISYVRITSLLDNCDILCNGIWKARINHFETYEMQLTQTSVITTSQPVEVFNCMPSRATSQQGAYWGDAAFTTITPIEQAGNQGMFATYPFPSRDGYIPCFYLDVATPAADTSSLLLDNSPLSGFTMIQSYAYKRMTVSAGTHTLRTSDSSYFVATASGVDENWGGYIFSINSNADVILDYADLLAIAPMTSGTIMNDTMHICINDDLNLTLSNISIWDSVRWDMGDGTSFTEDTIVYQYDNVGVYNVEVTARLKYPYSFYGLDLTYDIVVEVQPIDSIIAVQGTCNQYIIYDGHLYTENTDIVINTRPNPDGCDTVEVLRLVFYPSYDTTMYVTAPVGTDYQWIDGNTYTNDNNSASVMMHTIHGCDSLVRLNLRFTSEGIDALSGNQQITLMPNPTTSHVTVVCDELIHCIEVMDLQGRSVMKVQDVTDRASLSLGNLSRGTYLVKVVTQSGVAMRKLILE